VLNKVRTKYIYASSTGEIMKTDKQRKPLIVLLELALTPSPNPSSANTAILASSKSSLCSVAGRGLAYMSQQGVGGGAKINNRKKAYHITYSYSELETFLTQPMWQETLKLFPTIIYRRQRECSVEI
jgi:hypothetical protein